MTTIVYDHKSKLIACDSREVAGNMICSDDVIKYETVNDCFYFSSGSSSDSRSFCENAIHNEESPKNTDCVSIMIKDKNAHIVATDNNGIYKIQELSASEGVGSGGRFALSAIDFGKSAKEAVEYAMTRDVYTGGKVHVYDIEKEKFI